MSISHIQLPKRPKPPVGAPAPQPSTERSRTDLNKRISAVIGLRAVLHADASRLEALWLAYSHPSSVMSADLAGGLPSCRG